MGRWLEMSLRAARLRPARKCGEFRVGGTPGKTSGAYEEVDPIVMSETEPVKSFSGL